MKLTGNTVFITGDIHCSWANELTTKDTGESHPAAAEFVVPSVTSDNVNDFLHTAPGGPLSRLAASLVRATNPHVKWTELDGHGYGVLEVRPESCKMDWYHVRERTDPRTTASKVKSFKVNTGVSRLQQS